MSAVSNIEIMAGRYAHIVLLQEQIGVLEASSREIGIQIQQAKTQFDSLVILADEEREAFRAVIAAKAVPNLDAKEAHDENCDQEDQVPKSYDPQAEIEDLESCGGEAFQGDYSFERQEEGHEVGIGSQG